MCREWTSDEIYRFEGHVNERAIYKDRTKCKRSRWVKRINEWREGRERISGGRGRELDKASPVWCVFFTPQVDEVGERGKP